MKDKIINPLLLLLTAIIWGSGFVAQSVGMNFVQPFTFNFSRCIVGGIFLAIYIMVRVKEVKNQKRVRKQYLLEDCVVDYAFLVG